MEGVESVTQKDDTHLHWIVDIAGFRREFDTEITEQTPDQRIAWTSVEGPDRSNPWHIPPRARSPLTSRRT